MSRAWNLAIWSLNSAYRARSEEGRPLGSIVIDPSLPPLLSIFHHPLPCSVFGSGSPCAWGLFQNNPSPLMIRFRPRFSSVLCVRWWFSLCLARMYFFSNTCWECLSVVFESDPDRDQPTWVTLHESKETIRWVPTPGPEPRTRPRGPPCHDACLATCIKSHTGPCARFLSCSYLII